MYVPYGDYAECWDGAVEEVDKTIALCAKYNMTVLIDVSNGICLINTMLHAYILVRLLS